MIANIVHDECDLRTTIDREFETGTAYLQIINALFRIGGSYVIIGSITGK